MVNENATQLEHMISTYINIKYREVPPTEEEFMDEASKVREANKLLMPVEDQEFENIVSRLKQKLVIQMDVGIYIVDSENGHQSWLPAKRADFDFFFWNRYKEYLENEKGWMAWDTAKLGQVSDEILDLCGDPSEDHFSIRGLVLGDVQSGKTANYTAICNKAADTNYKIIIILAGMQENLRRQTQERLDAECTGRRSEYYLDPRAAQESKNTPVGVGRMSKNTSEKKIVAFTSVTKDFDSGILQNNNLGIENVNCPVILVVKKNKRILNNLITWLSTNNTLNPAGQIDLPLLLIDDEADNASVNTKNPDEQPTAINDCIRRLLRLFTKTSYLGITATPFANIFIDPDNDEDLFPADFIYELKAPEAYIGAERIFGEAGDRKDVLIEIDTEELESYFPAKHKKDYQVIGLPDDLYKAANYFLLANAVRDIRGDMTLHRSMMVHISLYVNVQKQIANYLRVWLEQVKSDLKNYARLPLSKSEKIESIRQLHEVWEEFNLSEAAHMEWTEVLQNYLYRAIAPVDVREVNGRTHASSLDYFNHKNDGLRVIAVGGNSLSRGLTLEGLMVTYFHRNTKMYDTLLQMGRWFGFRENYADLVKVWMSLEAIDWFGQITRAAEELKDEVAVMRNLNQTPRNFGLKVRQDPGALIVTARNKMRTATELKCVITLSGNLLETPRLIAQRSILADNEKVFKSFINSLSNIGDPLRDDERTKGHYYWEHVPSESVAQLILNFKTNPWHLSFNGGALGKFIAEHDWPGGWDVVLLNSGTGKEYPAEIKCGSESLVIKSTEKRQITADQKMISVSGTKLRVGSGGCTRIGLTKSQIEKIKKSYEEETGKKNVPDKRYMIKDRKPILMLHIIEADYSKSSNKDLPPFLFALGVGFPNSDQTTLTMNYKMNLVEARNYVDFDTDDYYDDEDMD